jgi:hypothetical protein
MGTHVNDEQNNAIPATLNIIPKRSNLFNVATVNLSVSPCVFGTVQSAAKKKIAYIILNNQKLALQLNSLSATPLKILPSTKPTGFPALKQANALFFLLEGCSYAAPRIPTAGGTAPADQKPRSPVKISRYMGLVAKPAMRAERENAAMLTMSNGRRPKVSATFAKKRRKAPELNLDIILAITS